MTTYTFSAGSVLAFDATTDVLNFDSQYSAADVTLTALGSLITLTTPQGSMVLDGVGQSQITATNITFSDGSALLVGDNTVNSTSDGSGNSLTGTSSNDLIFGLGGSDTIAGGAGNDELYGGANVSDNGDAADTIDGGTGSDIIYGNGGADSITGSSGMDTVYAGVGNDTVNYTTNTDNVLLYGSAGGDTITGGNGSDVIFGGSSVSDSSDSADNINGGAGADIIYANGGNDTVTGSSGGDSVFGGGGNDSISYSSDTSAVLLYGNSGVDTLTGGSGADTIYGGDSAVDFYDSADSITGNGGNDLIYGNGGSDTITGTAAGGKDTVYGGADHDRIDYSNDTTAADSLLIYGNDGMDTILGGSGNDTIYGGSSSVDSADSADSITAGTGADLVYANGGDDTVTGAGTATAASTIYGGGGNDRIDWSAVTSHGGILYGNEGADTLIGAAVDNTIDGGSGNDSITAGDGNDSIVGGTGSDLIIFTTADDFVSGDTITGGDGSTDSSSDTDTLRLNSNAYNAITTSKLAYVTGIEVISLFSDADDNGVTLTDAFVTSAANHRVAVAMQTTGDGTPGNLTFDGSAVVSSTNTLSVTGGDGADNITGGAGNDTLNGGNGADSFYETAVGGVGSDSINAGDGNDLISITSANFTSALTIAGGNGTDLISFTDKATVIDTDFTNVSSIEQLNFNTNSNSVVLGSYTNSTIGASGTLYVGNSNYTFSLDTSAISSDRNVSISTTGAVTLSDNGNHVMTTNGVNTSIIGGSGADSVDAGTGNDDISGGLGNDTLRGGAGADTITAGSGTDYVVGAAGNDRLVYAITDLDANDTIYGGTVAGTDSASDTDTLYLSGNGTIASSVLAHVSAIEAVSFLSDLSANSITLTDAFADASATDNVAISLRTTAAGTGILTVDASVLAAGHTVSVTGGNGNDVITGGSGNDTIAAGSGNESVLGGAGSDRIVFSITNLNDFDTIWGGTSIGTDSAADTDTLYLSDNGTVTDTMLTNIHGIEAISFSSDAAANNITLTDAFVDSSATDNVAISLRSTGATLAEGLIVDASDLASGHTVSVTGGSGADSITGGAGADTIDGAGNTDENADTLTGGGENDVFYFAINTDASNNIDGSETDLNKIDHITDFGTAGDKITLSSADTANFVDGEALTNDGTTIHFSESNAIDGSVITTVGGLVTAMEALVTGTTSTATDLYVYEFTVTDGTFDGAHIIVINNATAAIGVDDAFIVLSGLSSASIVGTDINFSSDTGGAG